MKDLVKTWLDRQGIWFYVTLLILSALSGGGVGAYLSKLPNLLNRLGELESALEGIAAISIPNILLNTSPKEELYSWGSPIPEQVSATVKELEGMSDISKRIVSISSEREDGTLNLELKIQSGNSLSPKDIKEYDFSCDNAATVGACKNWTLDEIETQISFEQISDPELKKKIINECKEKWRILQAESSVRYDSGGQPDKNATYEVICLAEDEYWFAQEVIVSDGNTEVVRIVD
ncbi:hypothetical protein [Adonisia turfae]|uniref:Uncharacterized protein n=1 Tax=Adonisia turfae CCMR0081 TaxID=2292702 RepID=A0A6M0RDS4_9CYAN|nr:hypothetical protein [Adonisia turfae]NEZ54427.1 hypothetical protein [Adonisia turfae CCMR0081]